MAFVVFMVSVVFVRFLLFRSVGSPQELVYFVERDTGHALCKESTFRVRIVPPSLCATPASLPRLILFAACLWSFPGEQTIVGFRLGAVGMVGDFGLVLHKFVG